MSSYSHKNHMRNSFNWYWPIYPLSFSRNSLSSIFTGFRESPLISLTIFFSDLFLWFIWTASSTSECTDENVVYSIVRQHLFGPLGQRRNPILNMAHSNLPQTTSRERLLPKKAADRLVGFHGIRLKLISLPLVSGDVDHSRIVNHSRPHPFIQIVVWSLSDFACARSIGTSAGNPPFPHS